MDIFQLLNSKFDIKKNINELSLIIGVEKNVFFSQYIDYRNCITYEDEFNKRLLRKWKYSYGRINLIDFKNDLNINYSESNGYFIDNETDAINYLQYAYNILNFGFDKIDSLIAEKSNATQFFIVAFKKIHFILDKLGQHLVKHDIEDYYIIVPNNEKTKAAAEKETSVAFLLYEYSSTLLKGKIIRKREILKLVANNLKAISDANLKKYSSGTIHDLFDNLNNCFNNFEIRHPNMDSQKKGEFVPELLDYTNKDFEEIYDTIYELILDAIILNDYDTKLRPIIEKHRKRVNR